MVGVEVKEWRSVRTSGVGLVRSARGDNYGDSVVSTEGSPVCVTQERSSGMSGRLRVQK